MYTKYENLALLIDDLIPAAEEHTMTFDRSQYLPFFDAAEAYISNNGGILGGEVAEILLNAHKSQVVPELTRNTFNFIVYIDPAVCRPIEWARNLADTLGRVNSPLSSKVSLTTAIYRHELDININTRPCVKILILSPLCRGAEFVKTLKPKRILGFYGNKIHVMDAEILLISLYRKLHSPLRVAEWPDLARREALLADTVVGDVSKKVFGAAQPSPASINWFELSGVVWIGDAAVAFHKNGTLPPVFDAAWRPQIMTDVHADDLIVMIEKLIPRINGRKLVYSRITPSIMDDIQLVKTIVYDETGGKRITLIETYNTPEYDLVPYINADGRKIASIWPTLRILFTELWCLRSIETSTYIEQRIEHLLRSIDSLRVIAWKDIVAASSIETFYGKPYLDIDARRSLIMGGQRVPPYYPVKSTKNGGDDCSDEIIVDLPPFVGPFGNSADPVQYSAAFLPSLDCIIPYLKKYNNSLLVMSSIPVSSRKIDRINAICCVADGPNLLDALKNLSGEYDFVHLNGVLHHVQDRMSEVANELRRIAPESTIAISDIECCPVKSLALAGVSARQIPDERISVVALTGALTSNGYTKILNKHENGQFVLIFQGKK